MAFRARLRAVLVCLLLQWVTICDGFQQVTPFSRSQPSIATENRLPPMDMWSDVFSSVLPKAGPSLSPLTVPEKFKEPADPKLLKVTNWSDSLTSTAVLAVRLLTGGFVLGWKIDTFFYKNQDEDGSKYSFPLTPSLFGFCVRDVSSVLDQAPRPDRPIVLYEYEASPFCRRVRETINLLDLNVEYRPCPGARAGKFSDELFERTGRRTVPYLVDPNSGAEMFESDDQIEYLLEAYGPPKESYDRKALWPITFGPFAVFTCGIAAVLRGIPGSKRQENARPDNEYRKPLELWGYEASVFCRPVREKLCALCLPHVHISCPRGSVNRDKLVQKTGRFQAPYLVDPNTGWESYESSVIIDYLDAVYTD